MPFAVWITGLPGSGKSTIAKELMNSLKNTVHLRLDEIRKKYIKNPDFTEEERDMVYTKFIEEGVAHHIKGESVVFDATAHRAKWRGQARACIKDFLEVQVECPIETCMKRESGRREGLVLADMYKKALERKSTGRQFKGLGMVVGVDVPYEESKEAEIIIDSASMAPKEAAKKILDVLRKKGWI